ncbi:DUF1003 domain-containing protein [Peristeroidobacter soli]|jgi:uncharacterized membrane protein/uncharacterized membrane protein YeaQ/YmgE (transglycosylase-associated protein family)|uniref:DUF1003 domain-containing protein n=1 Tax=Peristeroidobacter soli TaxID=2497877 RepID=UPI001C37DB53|nr:DUF1003 domain-containing protein [Peristeroidobacter soli]
MQVWQWLLTGLVAGWIARFAIRGTRLGLPVDLALGAAGGLLSGSMFHLGGITDSDSGIAHIVTALVGAIGALVSIHLVVRATLNSARVVGAAFATPNAGPTVTGDSVEQRIWRKFLQHKPVAQDPNKLDTPTLGERAADRIAEFGGSWTFLMLFGAFLVAWMIFNVIGQPHFDPYPFILLNLLLSCIAAVQAPIIMMSQNRQADKDRLHARLDYEVNLKAELEILALHEKLDLLREQSWKELVEMQQRQLELLTQLREARRPLGGESASDNP